MLSFVFCLFWRVKLSSSHIEDGDSWLLPRLSPEHNTFDSVRTNRVTVLAIVFLTSHQASLHHSTLFLFNLLTSIFPCLFNLVHLLLQVQLGKTITYVLLRFVLERDNLAVLHYAL
jgi:hypothetical protein